VAPIEIPANSILRCELIEKINLRRMMKVNERVQIAVDSCDVTTVIVCMNYPEGRIKVWFATTLLILRQEDFCIA
jgi:hypothetical protein